MKNKVVKFIVRYVVITLSAIMYGLGIGLFLIPISWHLEEFPV